MTLTDDEVAEIKRLKGSRSAHKSWVTRTSNTIDALLLKTPVPRDQVKVHVDNLKSRISKIRDIQIEICSLLEDDTEIENELSADQGFDDHCSALIAKYEPSIAVPSSSTSSSNSSNLTHRLPKVELKKFSGILTEWIPFYQQFVSGVDKLDIPDHLKLQFLVTHCLDDALSIIEWYPLTDESYAPAFNALKEKFGDTQRLVDAYVEELIDLRTKASTMSLRRLYDKLYSSVCILESLKVSRDNYSIILVPMLRTIFSKEIKIEWAKYERSMKNVSPKPNRLTMFLDFLKDQVEIREAAQTIKANSEVEEKSKKSEKKSEKKKGEKKEESGAPTAAFFTSSSETTAEPAGKRSQNSKPVSSPIPQPSIPSPVVNYNPTPSAGFGRGNFKPLPACPFCNLATHNPSRCLRAAEYSTTEALALIQGAQRCIICLAYHPGQPCRSSIPCLVCGDLHNPLLCSKRHGQGKATKSTNLPEENQKLQ